LIGWPISAERFSKLRDADRQCSKIDSGICGPCDRVCSPVTPTSDAASWNGKPRMFIEYRIVTIVVVAPMPSESAITVAAVNHRSRAISRNA
jgi:hypothetical protein